MFTLNNQTEEEVTAIRSWHPDKAKYVIFQIEKGADCGTEHVQGYVVWRVNHRLGAVRGVLARGHWEIARGTHAQCVEYSSKDDTRVAGPWEFGEHGNQGARGDLEEAARLVRAGASRRQLAEECPVQYIKYHRGLGALRSALGGGGRRELWVGVYVGAPGVGKTWGVYDECAYRQLGEPYRPVVTRSTIWFDGYDGEKAILLDDFAGGPLVTTMLQILDGYPMRVENKGGTVMAEWTHVFITSNIPMEEWWDNNLTAAHLGALRRRVDRYAFW